MKRKCIIGARDAMFLQMATCLIRSFTSGILIREIKDLEELYSELDSDSELFIVLDPRTFGFEVEAVCERIYTANPQSTIICMFQETCNKFFGLRLYRCGVNCIVSNVADSKDLLTIMRNAFEGIRYYPKEILKAIENREHIMMGEFCCALTIRQLEILSYLADKKQPKYIAKSLGISEGTVWATTSRTIKKLGVETKEDAIKMAIDTGIFGTH